VDPSHSVDDPHKSDDLVWATCRLDDGRQIRRTFTAAEADEFARGEEDGPVNRLWYWLERHRKGLAKGLSAFLVLLLGSLAIPAATRQWSDRQEALALKGDLLVDLTGPSSRAYARALAIPVLGRENGKLPAIALRRKLRTGWLSTSAVIDARFATYFGDDLEEEWLDHQAAMFAWLALGCCGHDEDGNLEAVRSYLHRHPPSEQWRQSESRQNLEVAYGTPWKLLECAPHDLDVGCRSRKGNPSFDAGYTWVGQALNNRRATLLERVLSSDVTGFSSGWTDFLKSLNPFND
jgi:hypothetical protein